MTFRDVAMKNFKAHIKKYFMCFMCNSFSIMTLFMYCTLLFNDGIISLSKENNGFDVLLYISMIAIIVFSIFFVNYANRAFLKSRYKEFGVMMTLGMNKKDITRLIFLENVVISTASLFTGIVVGALFSRLFQMAAIDILNINDVQYKINFKSFLITITIFIVIFMMSLITTILTTNKFTIDDLIKKDRVNEGKMKAKVLPGFIGILITISFMIILIIISNDKDLRVNTSIVIPVITLIFVGLYITISHLGMIILIFIKSMPKVFNRNIIVVTDINGKFNSKKKVIFILTMLSGLTVFSFAPPLALLKEVVSVIDLNKYDMEIVSVFGLNGVEDEKIEKIASKYNIKVEEKKSTEFLALKFSTDKNGVDITSFKPVFSVREYNLASGNNVKVNKGDALCYVTGWLPGSGGVEVGDVLYLKNNDLKWNFNIKNVVRNQWIGNDSALPTRSAIIIDDEDYEKLKFCISKNAIGSYGQFKLSKWFNEYDFIKEVRESLINNPKEDSAEYKSLSHKYLFMSKPFLYDEMKQGYKFFLFITVILGVLFFMASATVLFFNQYLEVDESKIKFDKLNKIGIKNKEIKKIISKELFVTFFTPVILGSIVSSVLMNYVAKVMGGANMINQFMRSSFKVIFVYLFFQVLFYLFTRRSYLKKIL